MKERMNEKLMSKWINECKKQKTMKKIMNEMTKGSKEKPNENIKE